MREVALDTETTGFDPKTGHRIIEIGCVEMINRIRTGKYYQAYIDPEREVPEDAVKVHGITTHFLKGKPKFSEICADFLEFIGSSTLVIHNAQFDMRFINAELAMVGVAPLSMDRVIDTVDMARRKYPGSPASLDALCRRFSIDNAHREKHGALLDSELLADVYLELTGGRQSGMDLQSMNNKSDSVVVGEKVSVPYRKFEVPEADLKQHEEFLSRIKNPLWLVEEKI